MDLKAITKYREKHGFKAETAPIRVCNYDDPHTMNRQAWQNGVMVEFVYMVVLFHGCTHHSHPWSMRIGVHPWCAGAVVGDPFALLTDDEINELRGEQ